jgi:hypothetical protein
MLKECAFGVAPNCSEMQRSETIRSNSYSVARLTGSGVRTLAQPMSMASGARQTGARHAPRRPGHA